MTEPSNADLLAKYPYGFGPAHWKALETAAVLAGWQVAREHSVLDMILADAIALAAVGAVRERMELWHSQHAAENTAP